MDSRQPKVKKPVSRWKRAVEQLVSDSALNPTEKLLYVVLALHSKQGECSIGSRLLGQMSGMSKSTVAASVRALADSGHIQIDSGRFNRNRFVLVALTELEETPEPQYGMLLNVAICPKCSEVIDLEVNSLIPHVHEHVA